MYAKIRLYYERSAQERIVSVRCIQVHGGWDVPVIRSSLRNFRGELPSKIHIMINDKMVEAPHDDRYVKIPDDLVDYRELPFDGKYPIEMRNREIFAERYTCEDTGIAMVSVQYVSDEAYWPAFVMTLSLFNTVFQRTSFSPTGGSVNT